MRRRWWMALCVVLVSLGSCGESTGQQDPDTDGDTRNPDAETPSWDDATPPTDAGDTADVGHEIDGMGTATKACVLQYGTNEPDFGNGVVSGVDGTAYVVGATRGTFSDEPKTISQADLFLSKITNECRLLWTKEIRSSPDDIGRAIASDRAGNVILVGTTYGNFDGHDNPYPSRGDVFVVKYDTHGNKLWSATWPTLEDEYVFAVTVDNHDRIYITGSIDYDDVFVVQFEHEGSLGWDLRWGGSGIDIGQAITIDDDNQLFIAGISDGFDGGEEGDVFVLKLNTSGAELNHTFFGTAGCRDEARGITYDSITDRVYLTGMAGCAMAEQDSAGDGDVFVASISRDLLVQWIRQFGTETFDQGNGITCDESGGVLITGKLASAFLPNDVDGELFVARYTTLGKLDWLEQWTSHVEEWGNGISFSSGTIFVTGTTMGTLGETAAGASDVVLLSVPLF